MARDLREMRKAARPKPPIDWDKIHQSWLVRLAAIAALLAFNFRMEDILKIVLGAN